MTCSSPRSLQSGGRGVWRPAWRSLVLWWGSWAATRVCMFVYHLTLIQYLDWNFLNIILFSEILHFSTSFILKFNDNFNNCLVKDSIPEEVNNSYIGLSKNKFSWKYNQHYSSYSNENYNPFNPLARKNRIQNTYGPLRSRSWKGEEFKRKWKIIHQAKQSLNNPSQTKNLIAYFFPNN